MAKIIRAAQKIFGETGDVAYFGQPGSLPAGTKVNTKDPATIQALAAYLSGMQSIVSAGTYKPALEDMNSLLYLITRQLAYLMQEGIPEWDATTTYYTGSVVKYGGLPFQSLQDTNLNKNPATETAFWQSGFGTDSAPADYKISAQTADHGRWLICPTTGRAVSRITYSGLYAVIGTKYGIGDGGSTFNLPMPSGGKTLVIKDTADSDFNDLGKTGGEKTHTLTIAEMPTHRHTNTEHNQNAVSAGNDSVHRSPPYSNATIYTGYEGGNGPHNNLPPYIVGGNLFISYK